MLTIHRLSPRPAVLLLCAALVAGAWGCHKSSEPCPAVTLTVTPNPATMVVNGSQQFTATGRDYKGNVVSTSASWTVVAGGGTINAGSGMFSAGAATGTFTNTVRAAHEGLTATATVVVTGPAVTLTVTPNPATLVVNTTQQFTATGRDALGNVVPTTATWSVVAGGGTINATSGLFTAGAATGTFPNTVRAASGTLSATANVIVVASLPPNPLPPTLGAAGTFAVLGGQTVTNIGATTTIFGDVGVSPGNTITGLPAGQPTGGSIHAGTAPAAAAQTALTAAYNDLAGRACGTGLTGLDLGGMTLSRGVYCFSSSAGLTGTLTLDGLGDPNAVFIFQIGSALTTASNSAVVLIGGAQPQNVYWQITSSATLGTGTSFRGNIITLISITLNTNASLTGRALARAAGAVTLASNAIVRP